MLSTEEEGILEGDETEDLRVSWLPGESDLCCSVFNQKRKISFLLEWRTLLLKLKVMFYFHFCENRAWVISFLKWFLLYICRSTSVRSLCVALPPALPSCSSSRKLVKWRLSGCFFTTMPAVLKHIGLRTTTLKNCWRSPKNLFLCKSCRSEVTALEINTVI